MTAKELAIKILDDFQLGMNLYEPSWDNPGEIITYTLGYVKVEIFSDDYCAALFELVHENPMRSTTYTYIDYERNIFYRRKEDAMAKAKSFLH
jgi:hypothetical protein